MGVGLGVVGGVSGLSLENMEETHAGGANSYDALGSEKVVVCVETGADGLSSALLLEDPWKMKVSSTRVGVHHRVLRVPFLWKGSPMSGGSGGCEELEKLFCQYDEPEFVFL